MKKLKRLSFGMIGMLAVVMTAATVLEKIYGTQCVSERIYGSVWFAALWGAAAGASLIYILRQKLQKRPAVFLLHAAFGVILFGAFVTWTWGRQGMLHLRADGEEVSVFTGRDGQDEPLPFGVRLDDFRIDYYPGAQAPMDYTSLLTLTADGETVQDEVAMNRILRFHNYRFYQSSYDADGAGTTLSVSYDPWGIGITYTGYVFLLLSMAAFFFDRQSRFRRLLRHPALRRAAFLLLFAVGAAGAQAADRRPPVLPRDAAGELGNLYIYYNDRICPLSTLAKDFTVKLCGKSTYKGYTPEQVLSGWMFWYDEWKEQPMILIKSAGVREKMGLEGRYARLIDFRSTLSSSSGTQDRGVSEADEKFNIVSMVCTGNLLRIFPYTDPVDGAIRWASQVDDLPHDLPHDQWLFIGKSMNFVNELVAMNNYGEVRNILQKIRTYQTKEADGSLPSEWRFRAERLYNRLDYARSLAIGLILIGFVSFAYACRRIVRKQGMGRKTVRGLIAGVAAGCLYLTLTLGLRGYISGHWPLSNGYETMQFMAWCTLILTLVLHRRFILLLPFGYLAAGLALMVSSMGSSNPQITTLIPVLSSPLLSVHVMLVMVAYSLFAFVMFNGVAGLLLHRSYPDEANRLQITGWLMLYPAVFCLAAGIFIGAIWANVSWGRYWGWDPKEVWALITLLVYMLPLHARSLPWFRRPAFFHAFCVIAFLSVLITYFGVNFLLGGMHSYAG